MELTEINGQSVAIIEAMLATEINIDIDLLVIVQYDYEPGQSETAISPAVDESVSVHSIRLQLAGIESDECAGVIPSLQMRAETFEAEILNQIRADRIDYQAEDAAEELYFDGL